jgi:uncharacterized OsmC-like protein
MMMQQQDIVNGVDRTRLFGTIEAVGETRDLARFQFRARNRWINGGHNQTTVKEFYGAGQEDLSRAEPFVLDAAEPDVLLGENQGANPVEYVLTALAGCLTTSLVYHAAARGITLHEVESKLEGDLDIQGFLGMNDQVRNGYEGVRVTFTVKGDASDEVLDELCQVAQQRSPVFDIVSRPVPVMVTRER